MSRIPKVKRNYAAIKLEEAMQLIGTETMTRWRLDAVPRPPSEALLTHLGRLEFFDLRSSEQAKTLLIDAILAEVVPTHRNLKVWKAAVLDTDTLTGVADYLIAPNRAYLAGPLLCVAEAKRDDFKRGEALCTCTRGCPARLPYIAEMKACPWNNHERGHDVDVYGIVSNGQGWQFYRLTVASELSETGLYTIEFLPELLGALDSIMSQCAGNVPVGPSQQENPK